MFYVHKHILKTLHSPLLYLSSVNSVYHLLSSRSVSIFFVIEISLFDYMPLHLIGDCIELFCLKIAIQNANTALRILNYLLLLSRNWPNFVLKSSTSAYI